MPDAGRTLQLLEEALAAMVAENEKITARAVISRMGGVLKHASDITRNADRGKLFTEYKAQQERVRETLKGSGGKSAQSLSFELAKISEERDLLRSERDLLIASHRAAILAVGEVGGASAWLKFFEEYTAAVERLQSIGAVPPNVINIKAKS